MIGVATIEAAIQNGVKVYAIIREGTSRKDRLPISELVEVVYGELDRLKEISNLPNDADVFYHFAWTGTSKAERDNPVIQEKNIKYSLDAVELAHICGCKRFIGAGSQAEYGPVYDEITEDTPYYPVIAYGVAKRAASLLTENLCSKYGMTFVWGRIFSVYGKNDNEGTMLRYAIEKFKNGDHASFSSGRQNWNYLHEKDAGEMFYRLGMSENAMGEYRIASKDTRPLREFILELADAIGTRELCEFSNDEKTSPGLSTVDERLFADIGEMSFVPFKNGILEMIEE